VTVRVLLCDGDEKRFVDTAERTYGYRLNSGGALAIVASRPASQPTVDRVYAPAAWHTVLGDPFRLSSVLNNE
jgi:hypothetical protein